MEEWSKKEKVLMDMDNRVMIVGEGVYKGDNRKNARKKEKRNNSGILLLKKHE